MTKKLEGALIREGALVLGGELIEIWSLRGGDNPREGAKPNKYGMCCLFVIDLGREVYKILCSMLIWPLWTGQPPWPGQRHS